MVADEKDIPDIYSIRELAKPPETTVAPPDNSDIFAIKRENRNRLDSIIGIALSAGVFLCNAYRLDKRLFYDDMGEIWKASDLRASRNVTIYLPPQEMRKDELSIEPIRQSAKRVEALEHPRIISPLENFTDPEHGFFVVRQFINGNSLDVYRREYIKRHKKFAPIKAIKIVNDIAHALDYVHSVNIVHGDLCPKNITIGLDDEVYVDNFAHMPVQANKASAERKPYLPPEIAEGETATVQSDVYALAVIAYELLSGRLPYSPESMDTLLPIPNVPSTVDAVIQKALTRVPDDRYDSCGAFAKALEVSFHESRKIKSAAVASPTKPSGKKIRKKGIPTAFWVGLALLCSLLITGWVIVFIQDDGIANVQQMTQQMFQRGTIPPAPLVNIANEKEQDEIEPEVQAIPTATEQSPIPPVESTNHSAQNNSEQEETNAAEIAVPPNLTESEASSPPLAKETNNSEQDAANDSIEIDIPATPTEPESFLSTPVEDKNNSVQEETIPLAVEIIHSPLISPVAVPGVVREAGEQTEVIISATGYHFHWCSHKPLIGGFWIQETMVTQELWGVIMDATSPQPEDGFRIPVRNVSWEECQRFVERLNNNAAILANEQFAGYHFALPTETQWEWAQNKNILTLQDNVLEWCTDWFDHAKEIRVIRDREGRNGRYPSERDRHVGFRLVIVPIN
jgi:serine/threonine protein kinase